MRKNQKGVAMIMVLCAMAVMMAVCLSLLYAVGQLHASAVNERTQFQDEEQALSFSEMLQDQKGLQDFITKKFIPSKENQMEFHASDERITITLSKKEEDDEMFVYVTVQYEDAKVITKYDYRQDTDGQYQLVKVYKVRNSD